MARQRDLSYYTRNNIDCGSVVWMGDQEYRDMMRRIKELRSRPGCSREVMEEFEKQIRRLIEDNQRMKQYLAQSEKEADRELRRIEQEAEERLLVYSRRLDHIEDSIEETERNLRDVQNTLEEEAKQREHGRKLAADYYKEAVEAFNAVAQDPYMNKFHHNDLLQAQQQLEAMRGDIPHDTLSGLALQVIGDVAKLKVLVADEKARFEAEYLKAIEALIRIQKANQVYRSELFFDSAQQNSVDLDFWTGDRYAQIERAIEYMALHLERDRMADNYLLPEVKDDIKKIVELDHRMDAMVEEVFHINELSELTEACGQMASQILSEQFYFVLVEQGFENNDPRGIYVVRMQRLGSDDKIELFFSRNDNSVVFNYHMSLSAYVDEQIMDAFFESFTKQIPAATLNVIDHSKHIDSSIEFSKDTSSHIEVPEDVKHRYGLSSESPTE